MEAKQYTLKCINKSKNFDFRYSITTQVNIGNALQIWNVQLQKCVTVNRRQNLVQKRLMLQSVERQGTLPRSQTLNELRFN